MTRQILCACSLLNWKITISLMGEDHLSLKCVYCDTVKPILSRHRIKRTPSIKRTVAEVPKFK